MLRWVLAFLVLLLILGCPEPRPAFVPAVAGEIDRLETRLAVLTSNEDEDGCQHALRRAKSAGGVIYVDQLGHCTFVRPLPRRR